MSIGFNDEICAISGENEAKSCDYLYIIFVLYKEAS